MHHNVFEKKMFTHKSRAWAVTKMLKVSDHELGGCKRIYFTCQVNYKRHEYNTRQNTAMQLGKMDELATKMSKCSKAIPQTIHLTDWT